MARSDETPTRRRGAVLEQAILTATLQELQERGYQELTMEAVAARAGASKNSVYRRWPTKRLLALAAVREAMTGEAFVVDTGSLRGDLLNILRSFADQLSGPTGLALRLVVAEAIGSDDRDGWLRDHGASRSAAMMAEIAARAVERGEVDEAVITDRSLEVCVALVRHHFFFGGLPIDDAVLVGIVDEVIIPLWTR